MSKPTAAQINKLRSIGSQMANVMFNLKQLPSISQGFWTEYRKTFGELQEQWDLAVLTPANSDNAGGSR